LSWGSPLGPQRTVNVDRPENPRVLGAEIEEFRQAGWAIGRFQWSADGGLYCLLSKTPAQEPPRTRHLRFAPPDWEMTDLGESLSKEQEAGLSDDRSRFGSNGVQSHDGTMLLRTERTEFRIPYLLTLLSLPEGEVAIENLCIELAGGTTCRLTEFGAPWW